MMSVPTLVFVLALFALIVAMHRGVCRKADTKLRMQFQREDTDGEVSRRLMRDSGYAV